MARRVPQVQCARPLFRQPRAFQRVTLFSTDSKPAEETPKEESTAEAKTEEAKEEPAEKKPTTEDLLKKKDEEIRDAKDKLLRTLADMQNLRDRVARDSENSKKYAIQKFSKDLLEVSDNCEMAIKAVAEKANDGTNPDLKSFYDGVVLTEKTLHQVFGRHGITKFKSLGEKFDPNRHEGLYQYEDPNAEPDTVGQVVKEGYMIKDIVLRAAQVGTVKAKA